MHMRVLILTLMAAAPAIAQFPPGGPIIVPDCPYEYIDYDEISQMYRYRTMTCSAGGGSVSIGHSPSYFEPISPACDMATETCNNPTVGSGNTRGAKAPEPVPEPEPIRDLPPAPRKPYKDWTEFGAAFRSDLVPCRSGLTWQQIRKFAISNLTHPDEKKNKDLAQLREATPKFMQDWLKAKSFGEQTAMLKGYNAYLAKVLEVSVPMRSNVLNRYRGVDLPQREAKSDAGPPKDARPKADKAQAVAVVRIVEGDKTFYFQLTEASLPWDRQPVTLRAGKEVDAKDDAKEAKFVGKTKFTHRVMFNGHEYLTLSKKSR